MNCPLEVKDMKVKEFHWYSEDRQVQWL